MASTTRNQRVPEGAGMFNLPKATYSKDTQQLLKVMMEESKLTNFQQRQLQSTLQSGRSLPLRCHPTSSKPDGGPMPSKKKSSTRPRAPARQGIRSKDTINKLEETKSGEDEYRPLPTGFNSTKEKSRLQNVMAFGCDLDDSTSRNQICQSKREEEEEEVDRFEEVVREIEERKEFLRDMAALGQDKPHRNRIMTEISQRIRELKEIDKARCSEMQLTTTY